MLSNVMTIHHKGNHQIIIVNDYKASKLMFVETDEDGAVRYADISYEDETPNDKHKLTLWDVLDWREQ